MFLFSVLFGISVCFAYHIILILKCLIFALTSSSNLKLSRQDYGLCGRRGWWTSKVVILFWFCWTQFLLFALLILFTTTLPENVDSRLSLSSRNVVPFQNYYHLSYEMLELLYFAYLVTSAYLPCLRSTFNISPH